MAERFAITPESHADILDTLPASCWKLYTRMRLLADFSTGRCSTTQTELAERLKMQRANLRRAEITLSNAGLIVIERENGRRVAARFTDESPATQHESPATQPGSLLTHESPATHVGHVDRVTTDSPHESPLTTGRVTTDSSYLLGSDLLSEEDQKTDARGASTASPSPPAWLDPDRPRPPVDEIAQLWRDAAVKNGALNAGPINLPDDLAAEIVTQWELRPSLEEWTKALLILSTLPAENVTKFHLSTLRKAVRPPLKTPGATPKLLQLLEGAYQDGAPKEEVDGLAHLRDDPYWQKEIVLPAYDDEENQNHGPSKYPPCR